MHAVSELMAKGHELPGGDPVLNAVQLLREPGALADQIREAWSQSGGESSLRAASIVDVHYKPWARARILAKAAISSSASPSGEATQLLFLQAYASRERAVRRFARARSENSVRCLGPAVSYLETSNAILWSLPNGPKLEAIRTCFDPAAFTAFLSELGLSQGTSDAAAELPDLVRYVPRRRALFLYALPGADSGRFYIKFYRCGEDLIAAGNLAALSDGANGRSLGFRVPRLIAHSAKLGAVVMDEVPGTQLTDFLSDPQPIIFAAVGRALARLHMSDVTPTLSWTPELETAALRKAMADVVKAQPELNPALGDLLNRIDQERRRLSFHDQRPIHGNVFADQILIDGTEVGIVDWDDLPLGDPLFDVGRLIAHIAFVSRQQGLARARLAACIQTMLAAYGRETGQPVAADRLRWQVSVALLMRAKISALRTLPPSWAEDVAASVGEAEALLRHPSIWVSD